MKIKWQKKRFSINMSLILLGLLFSQPLFSAQAQDLQSTLDPKFFYFIKGQVIGPRGFSVGDSENWSVPLVDNKARSATGKMQVFPSDYNDKADALTIKTNRKKVQAQFALYGPQVDLSAVKDLAALTFSVKVDRKPKDDVKIAIDCEYPCRGEISITKILRKQPKGEWRSLPLPLNCFRGSKFDLSKVNGVFLLSTQARMEISIADIRVERLPEGEVGCKE